MEHHAEPTVQQLFDLSGKVAMVTGASGHLGASMSRGLAEAGATVVATSRQAQRASQLAASLPTSGNRSAHMGVALDQLDPQSLDRAFDEVIASHGRLDVLVNNGHQAQTADWTDVTFQQFTDQLSNASGYFHLARHVHSHAVDTGRPASIILLGSMYGLVGSYPDAYRDLSPASPVAYHTLKGGLIQLTRHLAVYWAGDRVRVNCLSPGPFPHPRKVNDALVSRLAEHCPMQRMGEPAELKGAVLFLASDASSYMTGHNLVVDGGWTAS